MSERLYNSVVRILASNMLCSMATYGEKGRVHINTAFFCFSDDLDFYFLSNPASVHCQNISRSPQAAVAIFDSRQLWGTPHRGLQLFGNSALAGGEGENEAHELYSIRFPAYAQFAERLSHLRFYSFTPTSVKILDEEEFGEEVFVVAEIVRKE
ncbi:MAG TPA: pyridoxamine 5'-phosphate oxidase family protein [Pyrinomonadaceae bacterium]|nr:pyridoxamine 5'-phosphate oxidase family protein [Pyrinomonadaceae bacterium]